MQYSSMSKFQCYISHFFLEILCMCHKSATSNESPHIFIHFYISLSSASLSEDKWFCYYMKKLFCISACKIFGHYEDDRNFYFSSSKTYIDWLCVTERERKAIWNIWDLKFFWLLTFCINLHIPNICKVVMIRKRLL